MTSFFGERWDAPRVEDATQVNTPIGQRCLECGEPIEAGDRGLLTPTIQENPAGDIGWVIRPVHMECDLHSSFGHVFGQCQCFVQHPTIRAGAIATLMAINDARTQQGMGPL